MNYERPELLERLAGEYVLGTLRGAARRRFERLCTASAAARTPVYRWEDDLSTLSGALKPVEPSARVWSALERRIFAAGAARPAPSRLWRLAIAAGVVAAALMVGFIVREQLAQRELQTLAVLGPDAAHSLWRIERSRELTALTIRAIGAVQPAPSGAYELWALPKGGKPVSLGLLPLAGTLQRPLSGAQSAALLASDKLAVSLEPAGGSPTGGPTGPIVIVVNVQVAG